MNHILKLEKMKSYTRKKLAQICSYDAYIWLSNWIMAQYPSNPYPPSPEDYFYKNKTHREYLSRFIESVAIKLFKEKGCIVRKPPDKGRYVDKSRVVTDVVGFTRKIGSGVWTKDHKVNVGDADLITSVKGQTVNIEIKVLKDKQSDEQKAEEIRANNNNEIYVIIKDIDGLLELYLALFK